MRIEYVTKTFDVDVYLGFTAQVGKLGALILDPLDESHPLSCSRLFIKY